MAKKRKGRRKKGIKHERYKDHNLTMLGGHKRDGKKLTPPLMTIANQTFSSWLDDALPEVLWAAILASHLERDDYLDLFRHVVSAGRDGIENYEDSFITHAALSILSSRDFASLVSPLLVREDVKELLSALLLFEDIPDRNHWEEQLAAPDPDRHWQVIGEAVFECFDHQSEKATDCRWLKVVYCGSMGKLAVPDEMRDTFINFPNVGDMRSVRPSIRALEMTFRGPDFMPNLPDHWCQKFWEECWTKTKCQFVGGLEPELEDARLGAEPFAKIYGEVVEHCHATLTGSSVDPRHDGAFGLTLYGLYLATEISRDAKAFRGEARVLLRSIIESFLTLKFLSYKDDQTIWQQYRNYGAGQSKLSFLKLGREPN